MEPLSHVNFFYYGALCHVHKDWGIIFLSFPSEVLEHGGQQDIFKLVL
jgi:hypothetical protein